MKTVPLRSMAAVWTSSVDKHTHDGELGVQLCNYTDVYRNDTVRPGPDLMRATATRDEIVRNRLYIGDTVFTKDSEDPADIGISAYINGEADDFVCGYHLAIARPFPHAHPRYLTWALRTTLALDHLGNAARGISRYGIGISDMRSTPVPTHEFGEQRRIADFLDERAARIDQIIAARRHQISRLQASRPALLDAGLMAPGRAVPLKRLARPVDIRAAGERLPLLSVSIHNGVRRRDELTDAPGRAEDLDHYKVVRRGHIVVNRMRAFQGALGIAREDGLASPDYLVLEAAPGVYPAWLAAMLRSPRIVAAMTSRLRGIGGTNLGTVRTPRVNWEDMCQITLHIPDAPLQKELLQRIDETEHRVERMARGFGNSVDLLQKYKQSLITAVVTGELDVTTASTKIPGE